MDVVRTWGRFTARGLVSLAIAYALILKVVITAASATVVLPSPGQAPVICLTDHAVLPDGAGGTTPVDTHRCDDCSLHRTDVSIDPLVEPTRLHVPSPTLEAETVAWDVRESGKPTREAWGPDHGQRGPPRFVVR